MTTKRCPICGQGTDLSLVAACGIPAAAQHRCPERTLRAIDAARQVEERKPRTPSYGERLAFGFNLTSMT